MSELKSRLQSDMKTAMKAGEKGRLGVIRLMLAALKQREVDERIELTDADVVALLDRMVKQRRESISQYVAAGRTDLAGIEQTEIAVIQAYLPQPLTEAEIDALIQSAIAKTGAVGVSSMGKVMAVLKPKVAGRADMGALSGLVKKKLAG